MFGDEEEEEVLEPGSSSSGAGQSSDSGPGFVGICFCQECNNMLYPKEDKERTEPPVKSDRRLVRVFRF